MRSIILFIFLIFFGCTDYEPTKNKQVLDFGSFTIEAPGNWKKINARGIDSYVGKIEVDSSDTLDFDLGRYSNSLTEDEPQIIERSLLKQLDNPDTSELIIVENRRGIFPDKYKKTNISWDTIDGRDAKIISPIKSGIGITGIYIDSLWQSDFGVDRFNLYGVNLKLTNEKSLLKALRTLKFYRKPN